jgi:hypothetical protein
MAKQIKKNAFEEFLHNESRLANSNNMNQGQADMAEAVEWQNTANLLTSLGLIVARNGVAYQDKKSLSRGDAAAICSAFSH